MSGVTVGCRQQGQDADSEATLPPRSPLRPSQVHPPQAVRQPAGEMGGTHCHCCLGSAVRLQNVLNMKRDVEILSSNKCQLKIVSLNGFSSVSLKYASSFKKVSLPT